MASSTPARQAHGDSGSVAHGGHEHRAVVVNGVSSDEEPSVEWGWHGHYPKVARLAGFVVAIVCLILTWGNHVGRSEDVWLVVVAIAFFALSLGSVIRARTSWRR